MSIELGDLVQYRNFKGIVVEIRTDSLTIAASTGEGYEPWGMLKNIDRLTLVAKANTQGAQSFKQELLETDRDNFSLSAFDDLVECQEYARGLK